MDTPIQQQIADALRARLAVIANCELRERDPLDHLSQLREVSEKISRLTNALPPDADPRLRHYLKGCSFQKALDLLESELAQ